MRLLLTILAGIAAAAFGAFIGLTFIWPAPDIIRRPALAQTPPLQPITRTSTVVAPAAISLAAIQSAMEAAAPRNLNGSRAGATRENPTNINVEWVVNRGALAVAGRPDGLTVSTPLNGSLHANGSLAAVNAATGQLGGALGAVLGSIGGSTGRQLSELAGKTFDQRAELRGNVAVTARPAILPTWRIAPNLAAQVSVSDISMPIGGLRLNMANEVKPILDRSVREQIGMLEARVRNDAMLEKTVRGEWSKLCHSYPLGAAGAGAPNLWLEIKPTRVVAAQPSVTSSALNLLIGVDAQTRVVPAETKPECPFPAQIEIVPQLTPGRVNVGVPIDVPFTEVNRLLQAQLGGKTFPEDNSGPVSVTIRKVEVAASGDRLLISLRVNVGQHRFFSFGADATVHVWGRPALDAAKQELRLTDIELDVDADAALVDAAADAALPFLTPLLAEKAVIDLKPFSADARRKIDAVLAGFQKTQAGVNVAAKIDALRLVGIAFDSNVLRVIAEADGNVNVAVTSLALQ